jgi:hypothetical protein
MADIEEVPARIPTWDFFDEGDAEDEFGHAAVVQTLAEVVCTVTPPFRIGLVGEWGVGKSFVLQQLKKELGSSNAVFYFDAWKYGGESVKRSLLDVIFHESSKLDAKKKEEWLTRLYRSQVVPTKPLVITSLGLLGWRLLLPVILAGAVYSVIKFALRYDAATAFGAGTLLGIVALASQVLSNVFQVAWRTLSVPAIASPEEFETIFGEILRDVVGEGCPQQSPSPNDRAAGRSPEQSPEGQEEVGVPLKPRAVVLIDELDRCSPESRNEILQGLRTYLQNDRCIYVVACAPKSLHSTASSDLTNELPDEEFLRKLFSATCWIDSPGQANLRRYAERCMSKVRLETSCRDLVQILELGHTRNPRRIKHFLNTLNLAFRVAKAREDRGDIPLQRVTGNVAFLAKVLLIRQEWPSEFAEILHEPRKLRQFAEATTPYLIYDGTPPDQIDRLKSAEPLTNFLRRTSLISADDPVPFLAVTAGVTGNNIEPVHSLLEALENRETLNAKAVLAGGVAEYNLWSQTVFDALRDFRRTKDDQFLLNGIIVACALFDIVPQTSRRLYAKEVANLIPPSKKGLIPDTAPHVIPVALAMDTRDALPILSEYFAALFSNGKLDVVIGEALENNAGKLPTWAKEELNVQLAGKIREYSPLQPDELFPLRLFKEWPRDDQVVGKLLDGSIPDWLLQRHGAQVPDVLEELTEVLIRLAPAWADDETVARKVQKLALEPLQEVPSTGAAPADERAVSLLELLGTLGDRGLIDPDVVITDLRAYFSRIHSAPDIVVMAAVGVALMLDRAEAGPMPDELSEPTAELRQIMEKAYQVSWSTSGLLPLASYLRDRQLAAAERNLAIYILWLLRENKYQVDDFPLWLKALFYLGDISDDVGSLSDVRDALRLFFNQHPDGMETTDNALEGCVTVGMNSHKHPNSITLLLSHLREIVPTEQVTCYRAFLRAAIPALLDCTFMADDTAYLRPWSGLTKILDLSDENLKAELGERYCLALQTNLSKLAARALILRLVPRLWSLLNQDYQRGLLVSLGHLEQRFGSDDLDDELNSAWDYLRQAIEDDGELISLASNLLVRGRGDIDAAAYRAAAERLLRGRIRELEFLINKLGDGSLPAADVENAIRRALASP